jgi:ubiquinone biosynthesis protein UbiJ
VQGANRFIDWQKQATTNLAENVAEYLTIENPLLVPRDELIALRDAIDQLDADLSRAEKRLAAL